VDEIIPAGSNYCELGSLLEIPDFQPVQEKFRSFPKVAQVKTRE
jgi:hypothetical protein